MVDTDFAWGHRPAIVPVMGGVEIHAACRASAARVASTFLREEDFSRVVVLRRGYNAMTAATIVGSAVVWSYADHHGMELVAVLRRGGEFEMWLPGHHGHGPGARWRGVVREDGSIDWRRLPSGPALSV
ncbi:protein of unknown function [Candidatus Hydrogenisulfobacillus filiaventi]|uniref:Uncharacterized protein n=1 Tax=Candidatus Hydrogenisulfobacillus filiaventi TaxID=2707344 RepID=A0A6F8ZHY0_9FIRM|nr:protein of unknown function [Candidatus Hydrogenisulfobacillus filiaventi]